MYKVTVTGAAVKHFVICMEGTLYAICTYMYYLLRTLLEYSIKKSDDCFETGSFCETFIEALSVCALFNLK